MPASDRSTGPVRRFADLARLVGYSVWLLATGLLTAVAAVGLVDAISGAIRDPREENRAPAGRIVVAAIALAVALAALTLATRAARRKRP